MCTAVLYEIICVNFAGQNTVIFRVLLNNVLTKDAGIHKSPVSKPAW